MLGEHPGELRVVGATVNADEGKVKAWLDDQGAAYPAVYGVEQSVLDAYGVKDYPAVRVVDRAGKVLGNDLDTLRTYLP